MPNLKHKTFVVRGRGHFPFDMLRYDNCWPSDGDSAANLDDPTGIDARHALRLVRLSTYSPMSPTYGRWSSFGWHVQDQPLDPTRRSLP